MKTQEQLQYKVWHDEAVIHRFIEAAHVQRLVPMRFGPKTGGSTWPQVTHDWSDLVAQAGAEEDEADRMVGMLRSVALPAAALTRLDEVYDLASSFPQVKARGCPLSVGIHDRQSDTALDFCFRLSQAWLGKAYRLSSGVTDHQYGG